VAAPRIPPSRPKPYLHNGESCSFPKEIDQLSRPLALAWKYRQYNDGEYDLYRADTLTDLAAGLLNAPVWRMWWD
jgi:hypothetical protein